MEPGQVSANSCMDKQNVLYTHNEILHSHKKNEMPFAAAWMDLDITILSEVSQAEKDKYHMIPLICETYNMNQMNLSMIWKQTHGEQAGGCWGEWGGVILEFSHSGLPRHSW